MSLVKVHGLGAGYGRARVLHDLDFTVEAGEIVVILGANGAGKTTTLRALSGMISVSGEYAFDGVDVAGRPAEWLVRRGISHVPQGRGTFPPLTVEEHLRLGASVRRDKQGIRDDMERWFTLLPVLRQRAKQAAGTLSGGEQQMLAVAKGMMMNPRLLLLDEPSLGLAPMVTESLFEVLEQVNRESKTSMLIVEQNATLALELATRAYVMETGRIIIGGSAEAIASDESVRRSYLGY
jgi:branched-chain amino acid transport system ATP-binding protein